MAPPTVVDPKLGDYAKPGDPGCGADFEVCLTKKTARHYVNLINYAEEVWAKCRKPST